jgi:hypothetical protein
LPVRNVAVLVVPEEKVSVIFRIDLDVPVCSVREYVVSGASSLTLRASSGAALERREVRQ